MILDYDNEFTAAGGTVITNQNGAIGAKTFASANAKDWGAGEAVIPYLRVTSTATINKCTSLQVDIIAADDASATNPIVLSTKTIAQASLTANSVHSLPALLPGTNKKVLLAKLTVAGTAADGGGKVIVGLTGGNDARPQDGVNYL